MKAILLAAGRGRRLRNASGGQPKALLRLGGATLLERHIYGLHQCGIKQAYIVTGYQRDMLEQAIEQTAKQYNGDMAIQSLHNADYSRGSMVSLHTARRVLEEGSDVMLMDADVLYHAQILHRLAESRHRNCLLLDENMEPGDEPVKVCLRDDRIVELRKRVAAGLCWHRQGESVGFFRFDSEMARRLSQQVQGYIDAGQLDAPHEEAIRALVINAPEQFHYEDISGLPWIEIDFPADIARAETEILGRLDEQ